MKILFIGCVQFSETILNKLINIGKLPVAVCTLDISSFNSDHTNLAPLCEQNNIDYKYTKNINSEENLNWVKQYYPDVIFCIGGSYLLKKELLSIPSFGVVGYHPSILPFNRGRHPIIWALVLGLDKTGSTFFFMDEDADSGDIISQKIVSISETDDAKSLYEKLSKIAINQIEEIVYNLEDNKINRIPQDLTLSNMWRKRKIIDGKIDWRMSSSSIYNLVRGLTHPYVGSHFEYKNNIIKVWKAEIIIYDKKNIEPGKVLDIVNGNPIVKTSDSAILLKEFDPRIDLIEGEYL